jgi:hypothetical protein
MLIKWKLFFYLVLIVVSSFSLANGLDRKSKIQNNSDFISVVSINQNFTNQMAHSFLDPVTIDINSETTDSLTNDESLREYAVQINQTGKLEVALTTQSTSVWGWNFSIKKESGNSLKSNFCTHVSNACNSDPKSFEITVGQANLGTYIVTVEARNSFSIPTSPYSLTLSFQDIDANEIDTDGDGVADPSDAFPLDSSETTDSDSDGVGDNADIFPNDSSESADNDNDGVGDNADLDDDNDGVEDINDEMPFDETETLDTDGDGIGNNADIDDDGDGLSDEEDPYALDSTRPFYFGLISSQTGQAASWVNGVALSGSQFQLVITNRSNYEITLQNFTVSDGNNAELTYVSDDSLLGKDGVLSADESTGLAVTLSANQQGPLTLAYRYLNPNQGDDSSENITAVFNGSSVSVSGSYALDTDLDGQDNDMDSDDDGDGLDDVLEKSIGTNPFKRDSDFDSLSDKFEVDSKSRNPIKSDYDISAGWSHTCISQDDGIECWGGNNTLGQLDAPNGLNGSVQLEIGGYNSCALKQENGEIVCWGEGGSSRAPVGSGYEQIAVGGYHTCALKNGLISCRGDNHRGQGTPPVDINRVLKIVAGLVHTCALTDSEVRCWGSNDNGETDVPQLTNPSNLFSGENRTVCAMHDDGLNCWGIDNKGSTSPPVLSSDAIVSIGGLHVCAINGSEIKCWGDGNYGANTSPPVLSNPVQLAIGSYHSCALSDEGVTCWGDSLENKTSAPNTLTFGDFDRDGKRDNIDLDDDNDGVTDSSDAFPLDATESLDTDSDGTGNNADADDDNDGVADSDDAFPLDSAESSDSDGDGLGDNADAFPNDSSETVDSDSDGVGDNADVFPNDPTESADTDLDGVGDNADVFPNDASETLDSDSDGTGDNADAFPDNAMYSLDNDSDGMPNEWETRYGLDPNDASDAASDQDNDGVTALDEFLAGTIPSGSIDLDGNDRYDALTDGLLLLRGMFGLDGSALVTGTIASDATYTESVDIESRIETLGDLADIDGNGDIDALTDGLLTLRYLFGLQGDTLINGVVAGDATRTTAEEIEAHLETLMPTL